MVKMRRRSQGDSGISQNSQNSQNTGGASCSRKPCPRTKVCNPVDKLCYARGSVVAKQVLESEKLKTEAEARKKNPKNRRPKAPAVPDKALIKLQRPAMDEKDALDATKAEWRKTPTRRLPDVMLTSRYFPDEWTKKPGELGFVDYLGKILTRAQKNGEISTSVACPKPDLNTLTLQFWQSILKWYFRPQSPVTRVLLGWELGTGKTVGILVALDNYFDDPRPKVLFFHTKALVDNFYKDLARFPNKYRNWYQQKYNRQLPANKDEIKGWIAEFKEVLQSFAAHRDGKSTPLKCFLYNEGGNSSIRNQSIMKQYGAADRMLNNDEAFNFSNMIIIGDEAHQLTNPSPDVFIEIQMKAVLRCAERIKKARNSIVMMMTATPPIHNISRFMSVVTGKNIPGKSLTGMSFPEMLAQGVEELKLMKASGVLEGHITWYMYRDPRIFAVATPNLASMPNLIRCTLTGKQLNSYLGRRFLQKPSGYTVPKQFQKKEPKTCKEDQEMIDGKCKKKCNPDQKRNEKGRCVKVKGPAAGGIADLMPNLEHLPGSPTSPKSSTAPAERGKKTSGRKLACLDATSYVTGKTTDCKPATLGKYENHIEFSVKKQLDMKYTEENAASAAIKIVRMAHDAINFPGKIAIMVHKPHAYAALSKVLEMKGLPVYNGNNDAVQTHIIMPAKKSGELVGEKKAREAEASNLINVVFNDDTNFRGEKQKIILLNSEEYTEGVSLADVRLIILGDLSIDRTFPSWALVTQRLARALRQCMHMNLPENERTLETRLYATAMPDEAQIRDEIVKKNLPDIPDDEIEQIVAARTIDEMKVAAVEEQREQTQSAMSLLATMSNERGYWANVNHSQRAAGMVKNNDACVVM